MMNDKKRSFFLITGIALATIALVSIGILYSSYSKSLKSLNEEYNGDYHVIYKEITKEKEDIIKNSPLVENYEINREKEMIRVLLCEDLNVIEGVDKLNKLVGGPYEENVYFLQEDEDNIRFSAIIAAMYGITIIISSIIVFNVVIMTLQEMEEDIRELRIIGTSPRQVGRVLYNEIIIAISIGVPIGIIISTLMLFGNLIEGLEVKFQLSVVIITIALIVLMASTPVMGKVLSMNSKKVLKVKDQYSYDNLFYSNIRTKKIEKVFAKRHMTGNFKKSFMAIFMISLGLTMYLTVDLVGVGYINPNLIDTSEGHIKIIDYTFSGESSYYNKRSVLDGLLNKIEGNDAIQYTYYNYSMRFTMDWIGYWNKENLSKAQYMKVRVIDKESEAYYKSKIKDFNYDNLVKEKGGILVEGEDGTGTRESIYLSQYSAGVPLDVAIDISKDKMYESLKEVKICNSVSYKLLGNELIDTLILPVENLPYKTLKSVFYDADGYTLRSSDINILYIDNMVIKLKNNYKQDDLNRIRIEIAKEIPQNFEVYDYLRTNDYQIKKSYIVNLGGYGLSLIVILIGIFNIINTITMNILSSGREILLIKSVGASFNKLKRGFINEGLKYGVYGLIYSCIFAVPIVVLFNSQFAGGEINLEETFIKFLFIACIVEGICYLSSVWAINKIGRINSMEGIRNYDRG